MWVAARGDASIAICLTRLILTRNQIEIRSDLATILKAMGIIDAGHQNFCCTWTDASYRLDALNARIVLTDFFQSLDH